MQGAKADKMREIVNYIWFVFYVNQPNEMKLLLINMFLVDWMSHPFLSVHALYTLLSLFSKEN